MVVFDTDYFRVLEYMGPQHRVGGDTFGPVCEDREVLTQFPREAVATASLEAF